MRQAVAIVSVSALFLMGIVIGAFGMHLFESHHGPWHPRGPESHLRMPGPPQFLEGLMDELDLSSQQRKQVQAILEDGRRKAEALRNQVSPQVHEQMLETHARLLEVLTPEQRRKVEEMHPRLRHLHPEL